MKVRSLRVFDIRCACGAGPGAICDLTEDRVYTDRGTHLSRIREHAELVDAGWEWQEVDPTDDPWHSACSTAPCREHTWCRLRDGHVGPCNLGPRGSTP